MNAYIPALAVILLAGMMMSCGDDESYRKQEAEYNTSRVSVYIDQVLYLDSVGTVPELTYEATKRSFVRKDISRKDMMDVIDYAKDHYVQKESACLTLKTTGDLRPDIKETIIAPYLTMGAHLFQSNKQKPSDKAFEQFYFAMNYLVTLGVTEEDLKIADAAIFGIEQNWRVVGSEGTHPAISILQKFEDHCKDCFNHKSSHLDKTLRKSKELRQAIQKECENVFDFKFDFSEMFPNEKDGDSDGKA